MFGEIGGEVDRRGDDPDAGGSLEGLIVVKSKAFIEVYIVDWFIR